MNLSILICPECRNPLKDAKEAYVCGSCNAEYPVRHGVPILIPGVSVEPSNFSLSEDLVTRILAAEKIPDDPGTRRELHEIFESNYRLADVWLTAENNYYLERVGLGVEGYRPKGTHRDALAVNQDIRYEMPFHRIPQALPCGETRSWNVRLVNTGSTLISPQGSQPVYVSYRWFDLSGGVVDCEEVHTTLPVDMEPGRAVTIPVWIAAPSRPGRYTLELLLGQDGPIWHEDDACKIAVEISADWRSAVPENWLRLHRLPETYDYGIDHEIGRAFFKEELARLRQPPQRVLEVGGCSNPMTWDLPVEVVSTDIDVQTLQVGLLRFRDTRPNINLVAADALRQPFADGVFDCAVLFAALHHFLDPVGCLQEMRRVVRPGGFVAVLCEPIGSYRAETLSAEFRADLLDGINEQIFTDEEYARIFDEAGLVATRATIDGGSFKAALSGIPNNHPSPEQTKELSRPLLRTPATLRRFARRIKWHIRRLV